jgi:hypothetical protein
MIKVIKKEVININEYLFSVNSFDTPAVVTGKDAIYTLLIRLLLLNPGTLQNSPKMGVGIIARYRYMNSSDLQTLQLDIENQIRDYLPMLSGVTVELSVNLKNKELNIKITVDNVLYVFETDLNNNTVNLADI